ncbi:hypothetical protein, partial [Collinsella aerofaciens]|uniref:hypothetical protein n=1 Tax=Collinsella aerofaciens TaxID=74426 RepID=UPI001C02CDED
NRIPDSRTPGRLASDGALHQLSRHYLFVNNTTVRDFANLPRVWHLQILPHTTGYSPSLITGLWDGRMAIAILSIGK